MFDDETLNPKDLPIYMKGMEIPEVAEPICELIADDHKMLGHVKSKLLEDAMLLSVKVAGAAGGQFYDLKMEAAALSEKLPLN